MENWLPVLRRALEDPKLEGITCISAAGGSKLVRIANGMPQDAVVSEWKRGMGEVEYECRMHVDGVARDIEQAYREGARGGHPTLTGVYNKGAILDIIGGDEERAG